MDNELLIVKEPVVDGVQNITVSGFFDTNTSPYAQEELVTKNEATQKLVLDISGIQYLSSSGLRVLIQLLKLSQSEGFALVLAGASEKTRELFDMVGFTELFCLQ